MITIGIDWGVYQHTVKFSPAPGTNDPSLKIDNAYEGFLQLLDAIRRRTVGLQPEEIIFAIERRSLRIVDFLLAHGFVGYCVDPNRMKGYRQRYKPSGPKDDDFDAFVLTDILWRDRDQLARISPETESVQRLKALLADRANFVSDQTGLANRLSAELREYYPAILEMFADPTGKTALAFIEAYPNFDAAKALDRDTLKALLLKHHSFSKPRLIKILGVLSRPPIFVPALTTETCQKATLRIIAALRVVQATVAAYGDDIEQAMQGISEIEVFKTLPVAGPIVASTLYVILGKDRTRFKDANEVQGYLGMVPRTIRSGKFCMVVFRHGCRQDERVVLTRWAFSCIRVCPWARRYYNKKRREGKGHYHALRCLANILLRIAFAMWQEGASYNEDRFLAQMARHRMNNEHDEDRKPRT